jgi:hypothetical protein
MARDPLRYVCVLTLSLSCGGGSTGATPYDGGGVGRGSEAGTSSGATSSGGNASGGVGDGGDSGADSADGSTYDAARDALPVDTGSAPDVQVLPCSGLGAVDHFENITPPGIDLSANGVTRVLVDPLHAGTLLAGTDHSGLWKSADCGATWVKTNTGTNGAVLDSGTLWSLAIDPTSPDVLYAGALYGSNVSLFKSTDGGVDWDSLFPPGSNVANAVTSVFFQDLSLDPTDHNHIVVSFHDDCSGGYPSGCLAESHDAGATWRLFGGPLSGWREGAAPHVLGPTTWLLGTFQDGAWYTDDSGQTWSQVAPGLHPGDLYRTAAGMYYAGTDYGIYRSPDGKTWSAVQGAPIVFAAAGDGTQLFGGQRYLNGSSQPYFTSPESDGATWTPLASPSMTAGVVFVAYDAKHHVLYSANQAAGLWRVVTR